MDGLKPYIRKANRAPVLLAGDFNAPSHLDLVPSLQDKNCGVASFDWPSSIIPTKNNMMDPFRVANPDPKAVQATTWSTIYPRHDGETGKPEPQDRIDFIYHAKDSTLKVVKSERLVVGDPKPYPNHKDNEWTSDHAAAMTTYRFE